MNFPQLIGRLLGQENVRSIDRIELSFAEPWANRAPAWVLFGCVALAVVAAVFYFRYQQRVRGKARVVLAISRAVLLGLLLVILADPVLNLRLTSNPRPLVYVLFDGTDSMGIQDEMTDEQRARLAQAVGLDAAAAGEAPQPSQSNSASPPDPAAQKSPEAPPGGKPDAAGQSPSSAKPSRLQYVQALLRNSKANPLAQLDEKARLRAFVIDRPDGVRALKLNSDGGDHLDAGHLADQLQATGRVTALGKAFDDLALRHATGHLAAVVVVSDFVQNSGPAAVGTRTAPVGKLGVPVYTVGVGPQAAADLAVSISTRPVMKRAERDTIMVTLRQTQLDGRSATVRVWARRLVGDGEAASDDVVAVGEQTVDLAGPGTTVEIPFTPKETGRFELVAEVEPFQDEVVDQNNRAVREVSIRDDFLRLLYVEYEPTWEWRFIKEVFHRDKLVGTRGFRTFLRSSDPKVRRSNPLFVPTLTPQRSEFFANDVIFLGDMPESALSTRFCEMTAEFVKKFGGGLVVIAGPRFGPGQLDRTPLADILPVVVDPGATLRDQREFRLKLAPAATATSQFDFMLLGANESENLKAWDNLGAIPWYQPVAKPHPLATVLAEHPSDTCVDGKTPQPLIAIRQFAGGGKVVYLGFNETWRLRRKYGEQYYRQFWAQMIYHLGLRRALGSQKRFVVQTDRQQYQADDEVTVTVEAYDENFQPLSQEKLPDRKLEGELVIPGGEGNPPSLQKVSIPYSREGVFEARFPVLEGGEHRIRVRDPITREDSEVLFQVAQVSVERQSAVRNAALEREIALASGGRSYDLETVAHLPEEIELPTMTETTIQVFSLWSTWLCFLLVVLLMLGEWLARKWVNLP